MVGWINEYRIHGITAFCHKKNRTYSKEFKIKCVEAVMNGEGSVNDIIARYGISSRSVLRCRCLILAVLNAIRCLFVNEEIS